MKVEWQPRYTSYLVAVQPRRWGAALEQEARIKAASCDEDCGLHEPEHRYPAH